MKMERSVGRIVPEAFKIIRGIQNPYDLIDQFISSCFLTVW